MALRKGFKIISAIQAEYNGVAIVCDAEWVKNIWDQLESKKFYMALGKRFETLEQVFEHVDRVQDWSQHSGPITP